MKTDDLISMLAANVSPVDPHVVARRIGTAVLVGSLSASLLVVMLLGIRHDIAQVSVTPLFWAKVALPLCLTVGAWLMVTRLARPGMTSGAGRYWVAATLAVVWLAGLLALITAAPDARVDMVFGRTWRVCALNITMLSIPGFVAVFWALRGLAPTRPTLAGSCGGLLAGATATIAYCLHCPEMGVPFWGIWYVMGMLVPTLVGASLGRRLLRW